MKRLALLFLAVALPALAEDVGYYIGSFDPPTLGHRDVVVSAMENHGLSKVYITVNHNTAKDFNASIDERLEMMRLLFQRYGDRFVILREPLEGRVPFARYLLNKHQHKILGIFGDDTFDKNFAIFRGVANFDYIKVARPEVVMTEACDYKPIIYDMDVDSDGVSSSVARDQINQGIDPVSVLDLDVIKYIKNEKIYLVPPAARLAAEEAKFLGRYRAFTAEMSRSFPALDFSEIPEPVFKASQTFGAQNDKMIRHVVNALKMPVEGQFVFRPVAENFLGIKLKSRPLRSATRAGVYAGSFDPISEAQRDVIRRSIAQLGLEKLYVPVLATSKKEITRPTAERVALVKAILAEFGDKIEVLTTPSLEDLRALIMRLKNEHTEPMIAIFGSNVFDANYARMKDIDGLRFAVVPHPDSSAPVPGNVAVIRETSVTCKNLLKPVL